MTSAHVSAAGSSSRARIGAGGGHPRRRTQGDRAETHEGEDRVDASIGARRNVGRGGSEEVGEGGRRGRSRGRWGENGDDTGPAEGAAERPLHESGTERTRSRLGD